MCDSSSTSPRDESRTIKYDVFLSFRGEDTRNTFTDHLYRALQEAGLVTFRDNDDIGRGQELKPEIESAIIKSRASIVVLSENYAKSIWCLDELRLILEQRTGFNHFVLPIFYHVDPSDVRNQRRSFAIQRPRWADISLCFGMEASKWTEENMRRWKTALTKIADLGGLTLKGSMSESDFIQEEVVKTVKHKLDLKQLSIPAHLVGMESRVGVINSWLKDEQRNAIAICGMRGNGKTTLASYVYNLYKHDFKRSSFVEVSGKQQHSFLGIQKQLLEDLSGGKEIRLSSVPEGTHKIQEVLKSERVLIVLDDIDKSSQLNILLGKKTSPTQSKIIITTTSLEIRAWLRSISWKCWVHELSVLNDLESIKLLSLHAFESKTPMNGFENLAAEVARYCGGNPLALQVLGTTLAVSDEQSSTKNNMTGIWRSSLNSLHLLKGNLDFNIQCALQKSYDLLPGQNVKELFLHIACFFVGESRQLVERSFEETYQAKFGIHVLIQRCLLTISDDGKLMMHQLLQEMGRRVVSDESKDPAKRSRVWCHDETLDLLEKGSGSDTIEGLAIDMRKVKHGMGANIRALKTNSLAKKKKLKILQLNHVKLTGSYYNFQELRWLCWHGCPLGTIPSGLLMSRLVTLDMTDGHIHTFEAPTVCSSLLYLNLKGCDKLVSVCNLSRFPKLESLIVKGCSSLTYLCKSIKNLENLYTLDLGGCTKMWKNITPTEPLLSLPKSITHLDLTNCDLEFNNNICVAFHHERPSSVDIFLAFNPFEYLPNNINVEILVVLNLYSCNNLKSLPCIPRTVEELNIDWCTSLEKVTFQSCRFNLREFSYESCFALSEIQGLFTLVSVKKSDRADLGHMHWIKAYEDHKVDLVGEEMGKGRTWHTQVLYEYGIMSTYLQGINDQIMTTYEHMSSSSVLSFRVPGDHEKNRIQGLNVCFLYRSSVSMDKDRWLLLSKISNTTKGLTWIYNPVVYCKPSVDQDVVWLSYWPIGNILDVGDEVHVEIICENGTMKGTGCSASLVYMDDKVEDEENMMKNEEVIGGDLSEFEVIKGCYYLCRRDLVDLETKSWLRQLFGESVDYPDSRGWKKTYQSMRSRMQKYSLNAFFKRIVEPEVRKGGF